MLTQLRGLKTGETAAWVRDVRLQVSGHYLRSHESLVGPGLISVVSEYSCCK